VSACLGLNEFYDQEFSLQVYPNPSDNEVNISLTKSLENADIQFYNQIGQLVLSRQLKTENAVISLGELPSGIYLLVVSLNGEARAQKKIVKN
jgi:hypothetical protein